MQVETFRQHLYQAIWKYTIDQKEYNDYYKEHSDELMPEDFYVDNILLLIKNLNKNSSFYETYRDIIGAISDPHEREIIINFMLWFSKFKDSSSHEIFNEVMDDSYNQNGFMDSIIELQKYARKSHIIITEDKRVDNEKLSIIFSALDKFTSASKSLSERRKGKPTISLDDEYDIQDVLHVILRPHFPTIKIEEVVSGNDTEKFLKIDFVVSDLKVAVECKCIRDIKHARSITKELNDDIQTYHRHQDCNYLIFFVYDQDLLISNPDTLEKNYTNEQTFGTRKMKIELKIRPKN
jgi:hypothetical protein